MTEKRIPCEKSPNTGVIDIKQKGYKHCSVIHLNVQLIGNCVDQTVICHIQESHEKLFNRKI